MPVSDRDRPDQTLADYVGILIGPVLIMALVGSLVFFLLEVCYTGDYVLRMRWTLFFFVTGIVLVCRISLRPDIADRSWLYGCLLAGATWLALMGFVEYPYGSLIRDLAPVINIGLIVVVWWSASRLVRDCTNVDEDTDMSGEGLLQAAGIARTGDDAPARKSPVDEEKTSASGFVAWWERYERYRAKNEKKRTLGTWVIYFSLAALPLFGLGQSLIPPADTERRVASFWLLAIYVASGLGLLMTTCFLGLRRYLRQRRLKMPAAMTGVWLVCGVVLVVTLLGIGALIPRPRAEYALLDWQTVTGGQKSASRDSLKRDSPGKGDGRSGGESEKSDPSSKATGDKGPKGNDPGGKAHNDSSQKKGEGDASSKQGEGAKGSGKDKGKGGDGDKSGKEGPAKKGEDPPQQSSGDGKRRDQPANSRQEQSSSLEAVSRSLPTILKWIVFAIVGIITLGVVFFAIVRFLANFTDWAARFLEAWSRFWARLFARRGTEVARESTAALRSPARAPRPFSSFHNPFRLGQHWTPFEFCCYTFAAFEALARELGVARRIGETPLEHADRVGAELPELETDARRLALIYARGVYGADDLPAAVNDVLEQIWDHMEGSARRPQEV